MVFLSKPGCSPRLALYLRDFPALRADTKNLNKWWLSWYTLQWAKALPVGGICAGDIGCQSVFVYVLVFVFVFVFVFVSDVWVKAGGWKLSRLHRLPISLRGTLAKPLTTIQHLAHTSHNLNNQLTKWWQKQLPNKFYDNNSTHSTHNPNNQLNFFWQRQLPNTFKPLWKNGWINNIPLTPLTTIQHLTCTTSKWKTACCRY